MSQTESPLGFLDEKTGCVWYAKVPFKKLNIWLSLVNGNPHVHSELPQAVELSKILSELEARRRRSDKESREWGRTFPSESDASSKFAKYINQTAAGIADRGRKSDWRDYENGQGYTHLEELLVYQPRGWRRIQVREYFSGYGCQLDRESKNPNRKIENWPNKDSEQSFTIAMTSPVLAVLFHPEMSRRTRYEPLNFLLAYGVWNPLPKLDMQLSNAQKEVLKEEISPLDYFFEFQEAVGSDNLAKLRQLGEDGSCPRLHLIKELDFCNIIGQRLAKDLIRSEVIEYIEDRDDGEGGIRNSQKGSGQPLSLIFAGPSGIGKTELAVWLSNLLNEPKDNNFHKVDCGKLTDANELFGMSGCYQGAKEGSALNNFIYRISEDKSSVGVVLLDEIEKAGPSVIYGLYQVLDKGEWTNKKLGANQTETISCENIIFIMTTNAADSTIMAYTARHQELYNVTDGALDNISSDLISEVYGKLQGTYPLTAAFMGRVTQVVPFVPMANSTNEDSPLLSESMTVSKILIERELEKIKKSIGGDARMSNPTKREIAELVVQHSYVEIAGVRDLQKEVKQRIGKKVRKDLRRDKGGLSEGTNIRYSIERVHGNDRRSVIYRPEDNFTKSEVLEEKSENPGVSPFYPNPIGHENDSEAGIYRPEDYSIKPEILEEKSEGTKGNNSHPSSPIGHETDRKKLLHRPDDNFLKSEILGKEPESRTASNSDSPRGIDLSSSEYRPSSQMLFDQNDTNYLFYLMLIVLLISMSLSFLGWYPVA